MNRPLTEAQNSQGTVTVILLGALGSLLATLLWLAGGWLAERQVPNETVLHYSFSESRVGKLKAWYVRLSNQSEVAFDVRVGLPTVKPLQVSFDPAAQTQDGWQGQVQKGNRLEFLFVHDDPKVTLSASLVESLVSATFQERSSTSGGIETRQGQVRFAETIPLMRSALVLFWYSVPTLILGALLLLPRGWRAIKDKLKS